MIRINEPAPGHHNLCLCDLCTGAQSEVITCTCRDCDPLEIGANIIEKLIIGENMPTYARHAVVCGCALTDSQGYSCQKYIHSIFDQGHWIECPCGKCDRDPGPGIYPCMCPIHAPEDPDPWGEVIGEIRSAAGLGYVLKKDDAGILTLHSDLQDPGIIIPVLNLADAQAGADSMDPQVPKSEEISDEPLFQWPIDETTKERTLGELWSPGWSGIIVRCPCGMAEMQCRDPLITITFLGYSIWEYSYSRSDVMSRWPLAAFTCTCLSGAYGDDDEN